MACQLSPCWCQAIIWTNAGMMLIRSIGTNFSEILIEIKTFPFKKKHLKVSPARWQPFCLGLSELTMLIWSSTEVKRSPCRILFVYVSQLFSTKALPEPMLTYHQWNFVAFTWRQSKISIHEMILKIIFLKLQTHLLETNELKGLINDFSSISGICSVLGGGGWESYMFNVDMSHCGIKSYNWHVVGSSFSWMCLDTVQKELNWDNLISMCGYAYWCTSSNKQHFPVFIYI